MLPHHIKKKHQLIQILSILKEEEWKPLRKMAQSPFFTRNQEIEKLLSFLKKFSPSFSAKRLTKELIFKKLYPHQDFNDSKIRKLFSETASLVKRFLVIDKIENDSSISELELLEIYQERQLNNEFTLLSEKVGKKYSKSNFESPEYLLKKIRFNELRKLQFDTKKIEQYQRLLLESKNDQINYFEIKEAIVNAEIANNNRMKNVEGISVERSNPLLKTIYENLKSIRGHFDQKVFDDTLKIYENNLSILSKERKYEIYQYLQNIIVTAVNEDEGNLYTSFNFYKRALKAKYIFNDGTLSGIQYLTIVILGTRLQEYEWVEWFMTSHEKKLSPNNIDQYLLSANTNYYFGRKMFKKALEYNDLRKINGDIEILLAKMNQAKIYFELYLLKETEYEFLSNKIMLEKKWIKRDKNYERSIIKRFLNFHFILNKMLIYCANVNKKPDSFEKLKHQIFKNPILTNDKWIKEKLEQIKDIKL